jgi:hypothetical protein
VRDLPPPQQLTTPRIAVALVGDEPIRARARSPPPTRSPDTNPIQDGRHLGAVMPVSWGDDDGEGPPVAVTGQMELGRQPAAAAAEPLIGSVLDPLFASA